MKGPSNTLNIHTLTQGPNTQRNRQASRRTQTHAHTYTQSWASLLVTALIEKKERKRGMVGVRNERGEEAGQTTQVHCCNWSHCKASIAWCSNEKQNRDAEDLQENTNAAAMSFVVILNPVSLGIYRQFTSMRTL